MLRKDQIEQLKKVGEDIGLKMGIETDSIGNDLLYVELGAYLGRLYLHDYTSQNKSIPDLIYNIARSARSKGRREAHTYASKALSGLILDTNT